MLDTRSQQTNTHTSSKLPLCHGIQRGQNRLSISTPFVTVFDVFKIASQLQTLFFTVLDVVQIDNQLQNQPFAQLAAVQGGEDS